MSDQTTHSPREDREGEPDERSSLVAFPAVRPPTGAVDDLPLELSSFVGREREIAEVGGMLLSGRRLLTLYGPGGCGKTRLALAVSRDIAEEFRYGAWWVELAPISDPDLVPQAVAQALGVREAPGLSPTEALVEHLKDRETLLILDNCEHLVDASASLADTLLRSCPDLRILATSREALNLKGESAYLVPPLSLPDPAQPPPLGELGRYEAVALFVERARAANSSFELTEQNAPTVAGLCRALDGMPLAIELAAARTRVLSVEQIRSRLESSLGLLTGGSRTAEPRQRTLRAAIDWSYELLGEDERALFRRLSVFAGGFALEAAEAVCAGEDIGHEGVLDLLASLLDKSLVRVAQQGGEARYGVLEPVRQYALERLEEEGTEAGETRLRHAAFFVALAEEAYPKLRAAAQVGWLGKLDEENANLRGALSWALSAGEIASAARLGWALWPFWWIRNRQIEGRRWTEQVLLESDELLPPLRIRATIAAGTMAFGQNDADASLRYSAELMELSRAVGGDALAESFSQAGTGMMATAQGDFEAATEHLEEALPLFREVGEDGMAAQMHAWLGTVLLLQGDHEGARRKFEEGLALGQGIGDRLSIDNALFNLAQLALARGDHDAAFRLFAEGIAPSRELGDRGNVAYILEGLGIVAGTRGEGERAARLLGASEALFSAIGLRGHTYYQFDRALYERVKAGAKAALGEEAFEAALVEGRTMSLEQAVEYALEGPMASDEGARPDAFSSARSPAGHSKEVIRPAALEPPVLRIFAFGQARVERNGLPIDSRDWTQKPSELLYYLFSHPGGRTKEQIGLALWPDASSSQLRSIFHDTLYRLRRALGAKGWISYRKGRYAFERSLSYYYDVEAFEKNLSEAGKVQSEAPDLATSRLQEATGLYKGDFLEGFTNSEWVMMRQEELRRAQGEALLLLGRLLFVQERYAEAADAYLKGIAHDRFMEEAHRGLMRCYAALGEGGRALRHYDELVALLEEQLGTLPAPESRALYERVRAGEEI